jgi:chromosome segregation ATPase
MVAEDSTLSDARVAALESENASLRGELARARDALASLRARYHQILEELHLLKRRLHVAKAERLDDVADAQLAFDRITAEANALEKVVSVRSGAFLTSRGGSRTTSRHDGSA